MPKGPKGERRPADTVGCAVTVARIATGETAEETASNSARSKSGKAGGEARKRALDASERRDIARKAARTRWLNKDEGVKMSGRDKLRSLLFEEGRELENIKFFPGSSRSLTVDKLCEAAHDAIRAAIDGGLVDRPPRTGKEKRRLI